MTIKLYPANVYENPPTEFDDKVVHLAEAVHKSVKGFGTDENTLITELGDEPAYIRAQLYYCYKQKYGQELRRVMESELGSGGNLGMCMQVSEFETIKS
jgi:hypothetical protein